MDQEKFYELKKHSRPIVDIGPQGSFDCKLVCLPSVTKDTEGYKLYYHGFDGNVFRVGLATSKDGISFEKFEKPVLDIGGKWDSKGCGYPFVMKEERYKMWYVGSDGLHYRIGYAESKDGKNWVKHPEPVLDVGCKGDFDERSVLRPAIVKDEDVYRMVYPGIGGGVMRLGLATSTDGKKWSKYPGNPVLSPGPEEWDGAHIEDPHLIKTDNVYYLTYSGQNERGNYRIGLTTSYDGENYLKERGYIMDLGPKNSFEEKFVAGNFAMVDRGCLVLYYHGRDREDKERISFAQTRK